jgi:hypothetical protein
MASETFVTIAGISLQVKEDTAYEEEPEVLGQWRRLPASNEAQSDERDPKRGYACVAIFTPPSTFDTLREAISVTGQPGVPTPVTVTSPADGLTRGVTITAWVRLGRGQYLSTGAGTYKTTRMSAPLTIKEA